MIYEIVIRSCDFSPPPHPLCSFCPSLIFFSPSSFRCLYLAPPISKNLVYLRSGLLFCSFSSFFLPGHTSTSARSNDSVSSALYPVSPIASLVRSIVLSAGKQRDSERRRAMCEYLQEKAFEASCRRRRRRRGQGKGANVSVSRTHTRFQSSIVMSVSVRNNDASGTTVTCR